MDPYNKDTQADAYFLLTTLENFSVIVFLNFWVQFLAPVDHRQNILQDPAYNIMAASDVLKKLGHNFIQKRDEIIEMEINSSCIRKEVISCDT